MQRLWRDGGHLGLIIAKAACDLQAITGKHRGAAGAHQKAGIKPRLMQAPAKITAQGARAQNQNTHQILVPTA